jgi:ankyrin repeat protein
MKNAICILTILLLLPACGEKQSPKPTSAEATTKELFDAVKADEMGRVERLVKRCKDVNATDNLGRTPLDLALDASTPYMALRLVEFGARLAKKAPANVAQAAMVGDINAIRDILHTGGNVNVRDKHGRTALHYAARRGDMGMAQFLIENDADLNIIEPSWSDMPLHQALRRGRNDMIKLLIASGADVNAAARWGYTPLHIAADFEIVSVLIAEGAGVNAKDRDGRTPLDLAESDEVKKLLRSHGAVSGKELGRNEDD